MLPLKIGIKVIAQKGGKHRALWNASVLAEEFLPNLDQILLHVLLQESEQFLVAPRSLYSIAYEDCVLLLRRYAVLQPLWKSKRVIFRCCRCTPSAKWFCRRSFCRFAHSSAPLSGPNFSMSHSFIIARPKNSIHKLEYGGLRDRVKGSLDVKFHKVEEAMLCPQNISKFLQLVMNVAY